MKYSDFDLFGERIQEVAGWSMIDAPFALFQEQMEVVFRYAVVAAGVSLSLVPKILDTVDMALLFDECFVMIDPDVVTRRAAKKNSEISNTS